MKSEDIHPFDLARMFIGEVPIEFFIEASIRTAVVYLILMVAMRLMGKKIASQMGRNEMIAVTSMAAAIGVPLQSPDRGLLPAVIIAVIVVMTQQLIASRSQSSEKFERLTQDKMSILVSEGHLQIKNMANTRLTRERVFGQLRKLGYTQLGEVKRMYLEANGTFTVLEHAKSQPGLCILPDWDPEFIRKLCSDTGVTVCNYCGKPLIDSNQIGESCDNCSNEDWVKAVLNIKEKKQ